MQPVRSVRVLAVDDEPELCELTKAFLESGTMEVETFLSVASAKAALTKTQYDVIVSDYQMPVEDGIQFLKWLRRNGNNIPFILLTGRGREEVVIEALNSGADFYMQKGGQPAPLYAELEHRIRGVVRRHDAEMRLQESENRFEQLAEQGRIVTWEVNAEGLFTFISRVSKIVWGYDPNELVGKMHFYDLHPQAGREEFKKTTLATFERKEKFHGLVNPVQTKAGEKVWTVTNGIPILDAKGTLKGYRGNDIDITERVRAESALGESEANFRAFFASMNDLILVGTPDGSILFSNDAVQRKLGYTPDDLASMHMLELHPVDRRSEAEAIFGAMFRGERDYCPLPLAHKNGTLMPAETRVWFGRWDGKDCIFGISKDLTSEQEAQQRFERLFRHNPCPMALSSASGQRFTDVNEALLEALGYTRGEVIGRTAEEMGIFPNPEQRRAAGKELLERGTIAGMEFKVRRKDGTLIDGLFSGEIINSQGKDYFLTVMLDITDRKNMEGKLQESNERFKQLAEAFPETIFEADIDGLITYANDRGLETFELDSSDIKKGLKILDMVDPADQERVQAKFSERMMGAEGRFMEYKAVKKSGERFDALAYSTVMAAEGHPIGIRGFVLDISERKRAEKALAKSEEQYRAIFEGSPIAIEIYDAEGSLAKANPACLDLFGIVDTEEIRGFALFADPNVSEDHKDLLLRGDSIRYEGSFDFDKVRDLGLYHTRRSGVIELDVLITPLRSGGGSVSGYMAQIQDITERKRAQEGLLLTSDRLSLATRAGGVGIWDYDVVNDNLTWDDQMFRLYGKARERFSSAYEAWKSSLLPEDLQRGDDEVQMALRGEKEFDTEFRVLWQDGTVHYIRALALVQRDASGKALRMVGTNWDMTDLKRAEDALKVSESRFRDIFNSANDAIFLNELGPDFRPGATVDVNDAACRMLGYSHEELLRLTPNEFAPKRKESDLDWICLELKERGMVKFQEEELRSDGTFIPVEINARRIEFMNRTMALAVARDITERIRTEELLRQNEETLRLVVDAAPFPLMITDVDGTYILDGNGKAVTYFGLDLTQGQSLRDLFAQEAELQALMGAASEKGSVDGMEVTVRVKGGGTRRAIVSMRPMHHLGEARWIIATYDISERYAMEKALQQANKKLGMLNSITRHDVVNQILALSGYIELCKIKEKDETLQRYLERIAKAADNIRMQIAFTREYQDVGVQAPTWAAPGRQAAEAFAQLRPLDVTFADETEGVEVLADPLAEKVPYNLIDNSMRHGERVEHIKMSGRRAGDTLLIVYEDDGVGISEDDKKRLFEKGFGKNTGFGLFLCREILAITGITITETGKQGEGARFEMIVPEGAWRYPRGDK